MPSESLTTIEFWDSKYGVDGARIKHLPRPWIERSDLEIMQIINRFLHPHPGAKLIELGCGNSYWLPYFASRCGFDVCGIDYSALRANITRRNLDLAGVRGDIIVGDFRDPPTNWRQQFDIVFSNGVLEHFNPPEPMMLVFSEYLRPGGIMLTMVPYLSGLWGRIQETLDSQIASGYLTMDLDSLIRFHRKVGLEIIHASYFRLMDPSILNINRFHRNLRRVIWGIFIGLNLPFLLLGRVATLPGKPVWLCSNMVVIARKPKVNYIL